MKRSTWLIFLLNVGSIFITFLFNPVVAQLSPVMAPGKDKTTDFTPASNSKEAVAFFNKGLAAADLGETVKARNLFTKAIEKDPDFGLAYLLRANAASSTKEFVDDLNMGRAKTSKSTGWEKMLGDYMFTNLNGERDKGLEMAKKMTELYPDAARTWRDLGTAYFNNNQFDKAEEAYLKATTINPSWTSGYSSLVQLYLFADKKDLVNAEKNAAKVVSMAPASPGAHIILGDTYRAQNNFQKAGDEYKQAIQLDPQSPEAYYKLGNANIFLGNTGEARKNFREGGMHDVRKSFAQTMEASSYGYDGDLKKVLNELMRTAKLSGNAGNKGNISDQFDMLNSAALVAVHNGDASSLKQIMPQLAQLSKEINKTIGTREAVLYDQADMLNWAVLLDATEGRYSDALSKAEQMKLILDPIKDNRKLEGYYYDLGFIDLKQKNYKEAIGHLNMSNRQSIYNKFMLARAYEGMGDTNKAMEYYNEIARYNFNNIENAIVRNEVRKKLK